MSFKCRHSGCRGVSLHIPLGAHGLRLCKIERGDLVICEKVRFLGGAEAVDTVLRRASITGKVGPVGEAGDFWADILDENGDWFETIALDRGSWNGLKNHWMKCKVQSGND